MDYVTVLSDQLTRMAAGFVAGLPSVAIALAILIITFFMARFMAGLARRTVSHAHMRENLKQLIHTVVKLAVWIVGLLIAASVAVPGFTPGNAVAGLGIGAVAIGFAFQDIFENFLAGVLIMLRQNMRIGDVIECQGVLGRVEVITLRESHIRQLSNELTIMPNAMLFKNPVKVLTEDTVRRNELVVGVSYDTDLERAQQLIRAAVEGLEAVNTEKGVVVLAQEFNASSIDFLVQWWAKSAPRDLRLAKSEVVIAIKKTLDAAGIEIPYPYVVHTFKERVPLGTNPGEAAVAVAVAGPAAGQDR